MTFARNRKAYYDYEILDKFEAGIVLKGPEIKSIRNSNLSISESRVLINKGEAWLIGMSISPEMGLLLGTGIMGAFTTMSAYSIDLVELFESSEYGTAASYLLITLLGCPLLAYSGMKLIQAT